MVILAWIFGIHVAVLLLGAAKLHLYSRMGPLGRALAAACCRAPLLDVVVFFFTTVPQITGPVFAVYYLGAQWGPWVAGFAGFGAGLASQIVALILWMRLHELAHPQAMKGPRIKKTMARILGGGFRGSFRNTFAVWWTAWAVPCFTIVRFAEVFVYPPLTWTVRLPRYDHAKWVNVSRQKFAGLVGADRIWCLYCDWMTGVWSLGTEMLRNVESFWCPIRFASGEKCDNCKLDFPDVAHGWAQADGTMADVTAALEKHYPGPNGDNPWFGHPARLTVNGKDPSQRS